jgi:hypothetical protein
VNETLIRRDSSEWVGQQEDARNVGVTYGGDCEQVKDLCAVFPSIGISIFLLAFVIEAIHLSNLAGLVVSSEQSDLIGVAVMENGGRTHKEIRNCCGAS